MDVHFLGLCLVRVLVRVAVTIMKDDHVAIMTGTPPAARASVAATGLRAVCASTFLIDLLFIATVEPLSSFTSHSLLPMGLDDVAILGLLFLRGHTVACAETHALKAYDHR